MIKKLIAVTAIIALLCAVGDARMPQKGDTIRIQAGSGTTETRYEGIVTDFGNGLICINATEAILTKDGKTKLEEGDDPVEVCIGTGYILMIRWLTPKAEE